MDHKDWRNLFKKISKNNLILFETSSNSVWKSDFPLNSSNF